MQLNEPTLLEQAAFASQGEPMSHSLMSTQRDCGGWSGSKRWPAPQSVYDTQTPLLLRTVSDGQQPHSGQLDMERMVMVVALKSRGFCATSVLVIRLERAAKSTAQTTCSTPATLPDRDTLAMTLPWRLSVTRRSDSCRGVSGTASLRAWNTAERN